MSVTGRRGVGLPIILLHDSEVSPLSMGWGSTAAGRMRLY